MYKYNIIEQIISNLPTINNHLQFRYTGYCIFNGSIQSIFNDFLKYQSSISFKIFKYLVIEGIILFKIK